MSNTAPDRALWGARPIAATCEGYIFCDQQPAHVVNGVPLCPRHFGLYQEAEMHAQARRTAQAQAQAQRTEQVAA